MACVRSRNRPRSIALSSPTGKISRRKQIHVLQRLIAPIRIRVPGFHFQCVVNVRAQEDAKALIFLEEAAPFGAHGVAEPSVAEGMAEILAVAEGVAEILAVAEGVAEILAVAGVEPVAGVVAVPLAVAELAVAEPAVAGGGVAAWGGRRRR